MLLRELVDRDARIFLKSEWAPASDAWPAVSFSKQSVGRKLRQDYVPSRDFVLYVGTSNPTNTRSREHLSSLLSLVKIDLRSEFKTWELIPPESWRRAQSDHADRWTYAFAITSAWDISGFPRASTCIPDAYRRLGVPENFGGFVQISNEEQKAILDFELQPVLLQKQSAGLKAEVLSRLLDADKSLRQEIYRWAALIEQRVTASGTASTRWNPSRDANPKGETMELMFRKWEEQKGRCGLCQMIIPMPPAKGLLQPSPDRIDSNKIDYRSENVQITHLGCNYAKNKYSIDDFEDWLELVSGASLQAEGNAD